MIDFELSPSGRTRHAQILELAIQQARRQRRQRLTFRASIAVIVLLGIGLALVAVSHKPIDRPEPPSLQASNLHAVPTTGLPSAKKPIIEWIQTDPTIAERLAVPPAKPRWELIDDDQLTQELANAGRPAGLATIGNQVTLVFHKPAT